MIFQPLLDCNFAIVLPDRLIVPHEKKRLSHELATPQTQAVDVHHGIAKSWDYFKFKRARYGPDGNNTGVCAMIRAAFLNSDKTTYFTNASADTIRQKNGEVSDW